MGDSEDALESERLRSEPSDLKSSTTSTATFFWEYILSLRVPGQGVTQKRKLAYPNKNGDLIIDMNAKCCKYIHPLFPSSTTTLLPLISLSINYVLEHKRAYLG